jgi:hypothetical protein
MINIVNSSFLVMFSFSIVWFCPQWPLTTRTSNSFPFYKNLTCLTPFASLDIIAASPILGRLESYANISANHFFIYIYIYESCWVLSISHAIYAMINLVKLVFFYDNMSYYGTVGKNICHRYR